LSAAAGTFESGGRSANGVACFVTWQNTVFKGATNEGSAEAVEIKLPLKTWQAKQAKHIPSISLYMNSKNTRMDKLSA